MLEISKKIAGLIEISPTVLEEIKKKTESLPAFKQEIEDSLEKRVTEVLEIILGGAISLGASDLHIEPVEEKSKIRIRIDGTLQDVLFIEKKIYENLLSRIKLLSGLKLNITDRPQDGRFSVSLGNPTNFGEGLIEVRTSILPAEYGESIVLRILNPKSLLSLETLGLRKDLLDTFKKEIKKPNGMIIVTGPTGSGKTTTLYAFLKKIQNPEIKIITIEDPIEYHLEGISQTQVEPKKGYDFANGLRSIMRQDPDVILVGEIRDLETASIALQSALTGHLVLTTLHTNDAAGTVARLQSLGEKPVNIAPAINIAIAQRLVRKVCQKCKKLVKPSPEVLNKLKKELSFLKTGLSQESIRKSRPAGAGRPLHMLKVPKVMGCKNCNFTGYKGRVAVFEAFLVDDEIEKFILTSPSIVALKEKATKKGMVTMYQDGLIKVLEGVTTIEEVERVVGEK